MTARTRTTNQRLVAVYAGFLALLGLLWVRCLWLQVVNPGKLSRLADAQHRLAQTIVAPRGTIYDRAGRVLAMSVRAPSVFANPRQMTAKSQATVRLASVLGQEPGWIAQRLNRDKGFVWLSRQADRTVKDEVRPLRRQGIGVIEELKRLYPQGVFASQLLGFVDIDQKGLEGLELMFDGLLRGRAGWQSTLRDAKGDVLIGPWTVEMDPQPGYDLVLTIDSVVQGMAEEALAWGVQKFHAKGGSLVVMDPQTGEILALANQPTFDPNQPGRATPATRRNRAITDLAEPGSVFKVVTASALLEEGLAKPSDRVFCEQGQYRTAGRHTLHDAHPYGWLTFHDVIKNSSNIGTAKLAQRLKPETLTGYIQAFGFGRKTGIELPGEVNGMVVPPARWSKLSSYIIPIGQEVAVTPVQLAAMMAVIANGGLKVRPTILKAIQTSDGGLFRQFEPKAEGRILRPDTVQQVEQMLVSVVESGTGRLANVQGLTVAGKTGTAQKIEPTGRYSHSLFVASFVGYGPVPDSRFVIVVTVDEPHPVYFGGMVAAPIFQRVVEHLIGYWHLTPANPTTLARLP